MIGDIIKANRVRKEWTQEQLAERLNVTKATVSKWELHQSMPDIAMLPALGDAFGISMDELLEYDPEKKSTERVSFHATLPEKALRFDEVYRKVAETRGKVSVLNFTPVNLRRDGSCDGWNLYVNMDFDDPLILKMIQKLTSAGEYHDIIENHEIDGMQTSCQHLWLTKDEIIRFETGDRVAAKAATKRMIEKGIFTEDELC